MSTVIRVKRRFDHEPLDALLIAGKRRKTADGQSDEVIPPVTEVLKFAGTVKNTEDDVVKHINKILSKDELKANFKKRTIDITNKAREKAKELARENRYKVVKYFRSVDVGASKDQDDSVVTVIDVEHSKPPVADTTPVLEITEIGYVYDLYYAQTEEDMHLDDELTIHPFEQELVFDTYSETGTRQEDDCQSEDSNSESNIKNDYPDSDHSENSIDDEDMQAAVRNLRINEESSDLSSEDDFVYAIDENDIESHGYKYAKYKAKVKAELDESNSDSDKSDYVLAEDSQEEEDEGKDSED